MQRRPEVEEETVTDPVPPRPVPGPPGAATAAPQSTSPSPFAGLAGRPVADHVAVYEAEHERLQRELSTIDQL